MIVKCSLYDCYAAASEEEEEEWTCLVNHLAQKFTYLFMNMTNVINWRMQLTPDIHNMKKIN